MSRKGFNFRRESGWLLACLVASLTILPFLVYLTGTRIFGPYGGDGAQLGFGSFLEAYFADLIRLGQASWWLLLAPYVGITALRLVWHLGRSRRPESETPDSDDSLPEGPSSL